MALRLTQTAADRLKPLAALLAVFALAPASTAFAAGSPAPTVAAGFTIQKIASPGKSATQCDDLAYLDGHLFLGCQNQTQSVGGGGDSTLLEYTSDGTLLNKWSIVDKIDGVGADPMNHRVIVTLNEDAKTHLATVTPSAPAGQQVVNYKYNVDPASPTGTGPLHTGGGTDSVIVDSRGQIYIVASYGHAKTGTAVFKVGLSPPTTPTGTGTATLSPTFLDNATAANGNTGSGTVPLKLIDADSSSIVPYSSPRFAGQFMIDDQTALTAVFAKNIDAGTGLTALKLAFGLDDVRWATTNNGTLYIADLGAATTSPTGSIGSIYKVTGPFVAGTAYASNDSVADEVVTLNLANGNATPFVRHLGTAKGLVYVDASGQAPALPLASASNAALASGTPAASVTKPSSDSDTLPIVLAIVALVLAVGFGAIGLARRGATS